MSDAQTCGEMRVFCGVTCGQNWRQITILRRRKGPLWPGFSVQKHLCVKAPLCNVCKTFCVQTRLCVKASVRKRVSV